MRAVAACFALSAEACASLADCSAASGGLEAGDKVGWSVSADMNNIAIGAPGEDIDKAAGTDVKNAGSVTTFKVPASGAWTQYQVIHQDQPDVIGGIETGDRFGETVQAVNLSPRTAPTWQTLQLLVGVPGESQGSVTAAGAVQTMTLLGAPGPHNDVLYAGHNGVPVTPGADQHTGRAIGASPTHIYVGMPTGPNAQGAAYAVPWQNVTSYDAGGADQPVTVYQPGKDGIPPGGKAFGAVIR